jgi:hypothetical protein
LEAVQFYCRKQKRFSADRAIRLKLAAPNLKLKVVDPIALSDADFLLLSKASFDEIGRKFVEKFGTSRTGLH